MNQLYSVQVMGSRIIETILCFFVLTEEACTLHGCRLELSDLLCYFFFLLTGYIRLRLYLNLKTPLCSCIIVEWV
ncbi:hypothetical protein F0562_029157 [Nyssa sinensis]|uniref:Uncharacterized protein n=1 Tax=Nyssa sinensis TaxID=561372 RepID=A0A5J5B1V0_9ASTE|nr:hypothetical protein F0562_029157 [Nyssa sinensis]